MDTIGQQQSRSMTRACIVVATCSRGLVAHCRVSLLVAYVLSLQGFAGRMQLASRGAALDTSGRGSAG